MSNILQTFLLAIVLIVIGLYIVNGSEKGSLSAVIGFIFIFGGILAGAMFLLLRRE